MEEGKEEARRIVTDTLWASLLCGRYAGVAGEEDISICEGCRELSGLCEAGGFLDRSRRRWYVDSMRVTGRKGGCVWRSRASVNREKPIFLEDFWETANRFAHRSDYPNTRVSSLCLPTSSLHP